MTMDRKLELEALRTRVANEAASLADTITQGFDGHHLGGGDYIVEVMAPHASAGQSTGGGVQARQNIRLVPRRKGYVPIVIGTIDPVARVAEVRTFEHVAMLHELRLRAPVEITLEEHRDLLAKLDVVCNLARVRAVRVPPPPDLVAERPGAGARKEAPVVGTGRMALLFAVGLAVVVAALAIWRFLGPR